MRTRFGIAGLLGAATAGAVFDLQQVSRFNPTGLAPTSFSLVKAHPAGGFVVAGKVGTDAIVIQFDAFGGVVRSAIYDAPQVLTDTPVGLEVYSDGRILLAVVDPNQRPTLVQLSPTLATNWEVQGTVGTTKLTLDGSGTAYLAYGEQLQSFNPSGTKIGDVTNLGFSLMEMAGYPGTSRQGVVLAGRDNAANRPRVIRFNTTLNEAYDITANTTPSPQATFFCVATEADGDVVLGGRSDGTTPLFGAVSDSGVFNGGTPNFADPHLNDVHILDQNTAVMVGATRVSRIDRSGFGTLSTNSLGANLATTSMIDADRIAAFDTPTGFAIGNLKQGGSSFTGSADAAIKSASLVGGEVAAVGTRFSSQSGFAVMTQSGGFSETTHQFAGGLLRNIEDSISLADGSVVLLAKEFGPVTKRPTIIRYLPNGTLAFARTLALSNEGLDNAFLAAGPDGSVYVTGHLFDAWFVARIASNGTVLAQRVFALPLFFEPLSVVSLATGELGVLGRGGVDTTLIYNRVDPTCAIVASISHATAPDIRSISEAHIIGTGLICATTRDDNVKTVRRLDPTTGAQQKAVGFGDATFTPVFVAPDTNGAFTVAFMQGTSLHVQSRSAGNLGLSVARLVSGIEEVQAMTVGPNRNTVTLVRVGEIIQARFFKPNGFADHATGVLPENIRAGIDLATAPDNSAYALGLEVNGTVFNVYAAKFLANGARSAQRRAAGGPREVHLDANGVWLTGEVGTRKRGTGPFAARYSL